MMARIMATLVAGILLSLQPMGCFREDGQKHPRAEPLLQATPSPIVNSPRSPISRSESDGLTQVWNRFRERFPFGTQTVAISPADSLGNRVLVLPEPPNDVTLEVITGIDPARIKRIETRKQRIGKDGWVTDVVASVVASDEELPALIAHVSSRIFGTDYKAHALRIGSLPTSRAKYELDVRATADELFHWVLGPGASFVPLHGGLAVSIAQVSMSHRSAVYFSEKPGLLLWWLPKNITAGKCRTEAREFALDSDLIVGGVGFDTGVAVLARERQVPIDVLPPLRAETLALLDAVSDGELAQSYERNHPFAGRMDSTRDWAPAYLSPELVDTEYGLLLNVADQILKGWSNSGLTTYAGFEKYPQPQRWPFRRALPLELAAEELTYNWNTNGAGYSIRRDEVTVFALNRTGALPVSYIPGEKPTDGDATVEAAEQAAYEYFAGCAEPVLVRVVQYASLYQCLHALHAGEATAPVPRTTAAEDALNQLGRELLTAFAKSDGAERDRVAELIRRQVVAAGGELSHATARESVDEVSEFVSHDPRVAVMLLERGAIGVIDEVAAGFGTQVGIVLSNFAAMSAFPYQLTKAAKGNGWTHTPVIVVSQNSGAMADATGGHNLRSHITEFRLQKGLAKGEVKLAQEGDRSILLVSAEDGGRIAKTVEQAGKWWDDPENAATAVREALGRVASAPPRPLATALRVTSGRMSSAGRARGLAFYGEAEARQFVRGGHWGERHGVGARGAGGAPELEGATAARVSVAREADGTYRVISGGGARIDFYTAEDAVNATVGALDTSSSIGSRVIELRGMSLTEAEAFVGSSEIRASAGSVRGGAVGMLRVRGLKRGFARELSEYRLAIKTATIREQIVEAAGGIRESVFEVHIPSGIAGKPPMLIRIRALFAKLLDAQTYAKWRVRIGQAIHAALGSASDGLDLNLRIRLELRNLKKESGGTFETIRQQIHLEAGEGYFVRLLKGRRCEIHDEVECLPA